MSYSYHSEYSSDVRFAAFVESRTRVLTALLGSHPPSDEQLNRLILILTDAAMAADQRVLDELPELFESLRSFITLERESWWDRWLGRIDGIEAALGFAVCLRLVSSGT